MISKEAVLYNMALAQFQKEAGMSDWLGEVAHGIHTTISSAQRGHGYGGQHPAREGLETAHSLMKSLPGHLHETVMHLASKGKEALHAGLHHAAGLAHRAGPAIQEFAGHAHEKLKELGHHLHNAYQQARGHYARMGSGSRNTGLHHFPDSYDEWTNKHETHGTWPSESARGMEQGFDWSRRTFNHREGASEARPRDLTGVWDKK